MNVLNIPKQADHELWYSYHALEMAKSRNVPKPKYLPLDAKCVGTKIENGQYSYTIEYTFNGLTYILILGEDGDVITVYPRGRKNFISYQEETKMLKLIEFKEKQAKLYEKQQVFKITSVSKLLTKRRLSFNESLLLYEISQVEKQKETFIKQCA
jgi:hypothetical protein